MPSTDIPVLVTAFNRPESLSTCLNALAEAGASNVLVSVDGPRRGRSTDLEAIAAVHKVAEQQLPDFEHAEMRTHSSNKGCAESVISAVDWAFGITSTIIVVEDDVLVSRDFLAFATAALKALGRDTRIGSVSGSCLVPPYALSRPADPARLSVFTNSWGWGTWADRWEAMNRYGPIGVTSTRTPLPPICDSWASRYYWERVFRDTSDGRIDSWAYRWLWTHWAQGWYCLNTNRSLAVNRGFAPEGTHTTKSAPKWLDSEISSGGGLAPNEPGLAAAKDWKADRWLLSHHFKATPLHLWYSRWRRLRRRRSDQQ